MDTLNRVAIAVKSGDPYLAWARAISGKDAGPEVLSAAEFELIVLVDEPDELDPDRLITEHYPEIFAEMLNAWDRDRGLWPQQRTEAVFREWFHVRIVDMVCDLGQ